MIRTHVVEENSQLKEGGVAVAIAFSGTYRWIDIEAQTPEDMAWLGENFRFHPLALEDCLHLDQRPKMEEYEDSLFIVVHAFSTAAGELEVHELHTFVMSKLLVTVHADPLPAVDAVRARLRREPEHLTKGPDALLHLLLDAVTETHSPVIEELQDRLDTLEEELLSSPTKTLLEGLFDLRKKLVLLRRAVAPTRDMLLSLSRNERIHAGIAPYFRDVYDHVHRAVEEIDSARDMLNDILAAYHSEVAHRTNVVMKRLTLFSALLLPLTFITGFFGMNFTGIPYDDPGMLLAAFAAIIVLPAATVASFRLLRWI